VIQPTCKQAGGSRSITNPLPLLIVVWTIHGLIVVVWKTNIRRDRGGTQLLGWSGQAPPRLQESTPRLSSTHRVGRGLEPKPRCTTCLPGVANLLPLLLPTFSRQTSQTQARRGKETVGASGTNPSQCLHLHGLVAKAIF
jgi:hypothetical protein